ncbi:hypothetical protein VTI74DRAFT_4018 [Chaetomium olivicolor]
MQRLRSRLPSFGPSILSTGPRTHVAGPTGPTESGLWASVGPHGKRWVARGMAGEGTRGAWICQPFPPDFSRLCNKGLTPSAPSLGTVAVWKRSIEFPLRKQLGGKRRLREGHLLLDETGRTRACCLMCCCLSAASPLPSNDLPSLTDQAAMAAQQLANCSSELRDGFGR